MHISGKTSSHQYNLYYERYGNGPNTLITFHGYGQSPKVFHETEFFFRNHTIISVSLFFHHNSTLDGSEPLSSEEWIDIWKHLLRKEKVKSCEIIAFSIGCRLASRILIDAPETVTSAYLLAPDGITKDPIFKLATSTSLGRHLFKRCISSGLVNSITRLGTKLNVIPKSLAVMTEAQISSKSRRNRLFHTWTSLKDLHLETKNDLNQLADTKTTIILAEKDSIISNRGIKRRVRKSLPVTILPCSHFNLLKSFMRHKEQLCNK